MHPGTAAARSGALETPADAPQGRRAWLPLCSKNHDDHLIDTGARDCVNSALKALSGRGDPALASSRTHPLSVASNTVFGGTPMRFFRQLTLLALTIGLGLNLAGCQPSDSKAKKQPSLVSIAVSPATSTVMLSSTQALRVVATFSNDSTLDVTSSSSFASSATSVALVSSAGVVTAVKAGDATITATYSALGITKTATSAVTVPSATIVSIAVTPTAPTVAVGATQPLTVTGTYNEGSKAVISTGLTFVSSEPSIATVGAAGVVAGVAEGTATITTTETTSGKSTTTLVTVSAGGGSGCGITEPTCAPATVIPADNVMIYSDGETVPGFDSCPNWGQATICHGEVTIAGNKSLWYSALNYEGLDWSANPVDVTSRAKLHIDFWTPDLESVKVSLIGGGQENAVAQVLTTGSWNSVDIDLSAYTAPDLSAIAQIKLESAAPGTIYVDNIYFWGTADGGGGDSGNTGTCTAPCIDFSSPDVGYDPFEGLVSAAQADDPVDATNKVAEFVKDQTGQPWAGATVYTIATDKSVPRFDLSTAANKKVTLRVFSPAVGKTVRLKLENAADVNVYLEKDALTTMAYQWETLEFDFANPVNGVYNAANTYNKVSLFPAFSTVAPPADKETYYFDELKYVAMAGGGGTAPTDAPTTLIPAGSVTIYSDATAVANFNPYPNWGQATQFSEVTIAGNKSLKYTSLNYEGIEWIPGKVDVSAKGTFHLDLWSPDLASVKVSLISTATGQETGVTVPLTAGTWNSIDLPLASFTAPDLAQIDQIKLDAQPASGTLYVDNIYFSGTAGGGGGGGCTEMGCAGPVMIPVATTNDVFGFIKIGDGIFAEDYIGALEANNYHGGWTGAATIGAASGGSINYYNDPLMSSSGQKVDEGGWVVGTIDNPGGVPSFFRYFVFTAPGSTFASSYMGLYANSPTNGTVDVSGYASIKFKLWGPAEMYERANFDPVIEVTLSGPAVAGCVATGSGGTEISTTFVANQKVGAGSSYKLPLAGWAVKGVCGTDTAGTAVASVLGHLARVAVTVPGSSFNFTNASGVGEYPTGVNLGPVAFTNN
jgi:Bacterial Ig-like domain (group 2)